MDDRALLRQFEGYTFPFEEWNHRTHVKITYLYLRDYPFDVALEKVRKGIKAYNATNNVSEGELEGYNETTTHAFMPLAHATMSAYGELYPTPDADSFCDTHPQLLTKHVLRVLYSPGRRRNSHAKTRFLEPDLSWRRLAMDGLRLDHLYIVHPG